jgi:hypothetical protein
MIVFVSNKGFLESLGLNCSFQVCNKSLKKIESIVRSALESMGITYFSPAPKSGFLKYLEDTITS